MPYEINIDTTKIEPQISKENPVLKLDINFTRLIKQSKQEELNNIKSLIELHTNCHKYHKIDGKDATCLDIILKNIEDELGELGE